MTFNVSEVIQPGWTPIGATYHNNLAIDGSLSYINRNFTNERQTGYISGFKLYPNLTGIPGWNITLYNQTGGDVLFDSQLTGSDGSYNFTGLPYGVTFNVSEVIQPGWTPIGATYHNNLAIDGSLSYMNRNFTNERQTGYISGFKLYPNLTGIPGWNITLYNQTGGDVLFDSQLTGSDGSYNFTGLPYGVTFNVSEVIQPGWTPIGATYHNNLAIDGSLSYMNRNFTNERQTGYISGFKLYPNLTGIPGWNITLYNQTGGDVLFDSQLTGSDGSYNFTGLPYGVTFNVSEVIQPGWTPIGATYHNNLAIDGSLSYMNRNFTNERQTGYISGFKLYPNLTGIPGWNITLYNQTGGDVLFDSQLTGSDGSYNFTGLPYGVTFNVSEVIQPGWTPIGATYHNNLAIDGSLSYINRNFTNERQTGYISGFKLYPNLTGIPGWNITLYNQTGGDVLFDSQLTGSDGSYNFTGLPYGVTFNVSEVILPGWTPIGATYHNNLAIDGSLSYMNRNFTNERQTGYISGFKLYPNLTGIPGWNITLYNQTGGDVLFDSQLTGSDGSYNFTGLPYGVTFNVSEVIQPGWTPIGATYHNNLAIDGSLSYINRNFTNERQTGYISGFKLYPNLTGIPGWNITLYNQTGGDVLFDSQLTGSDGSYNFTGLPYGVTFNVSEVIQPGWTPIGATYHNNLAIDGSLSYMNRNFTNERQTGYISGFKLYPNLTGIPGWNITLYNQTGGDVLFDSQLTGSDGSYNFTGLPYGVTFNVSEVIQPGWTPIGATYHNNLAIDGSLSYMNRNFTNERQLGNISGTKYNDLNGNGIKEITEPPVPGVVVTLYYQNGTLFGTQTTNANGRYVFYPVPLGSYVLNETVPSGWKQTQPASGNYGIIVNSTSRNFTMVFGNQEIPQPCSCPTKAKFIWSQAPSPARTIKFTDASGGNAISWLYDFGDGKYSPAPSPSHTYLRAGTYTVKFNVKGCNCDGTTYWTYYSTRVTVR